MSSSAMNRENPSRRIIPKVWMYVSTLCPRSEFLIFSGRSALIVVETSRPPSRAGNGRILMTPRLIESRATTINIIFHVIQRSMREMNQAPIPIGPATIASAISRSLGVSGITRSLIVFQKTSRVIYERTYVSFIALLRASGREYWSLNCVFTERYL